MKDTVDMTIQQHLLLIASEMKRLFKGSNKQVMRQKDDGNYTIWHYGGLSEDDLLKHLNGNISVSIYLLDDNDYCSTLCLDIDIPRKEIPDNAEDIKLKKQKEYLQIVEKIVKYVKQTYCLDNKMILLEDTGGRGYHLWFFFHSPQPINLVLAFANDIKLGTEIDNLEIFPKSASRGKKGLSSSNMRLPLGIHRKYQGARSTFLNIDNYEPISLKETLDILRNVKFISHDTLQKAKSFLEIKYCTVLKQNQDIKVEEKTDLKGKNKDFIGLSGSILTLCPVLSELISKAKHDGHLLHHERLALATTLIHFEDGEKKIHEIMSYCSDYSKEETQRQINSIKGYWPYSCRRLQGIEFNLCSGWCCNQLKEKAEQGKSPSPISFAKLSKPQEEIKIDKEDVKRIERIASIENLYQAWNQAYMQAKERDIFEDVLAYEIFKDHLWANLHIIRSQLLKNQWEHKPFRVVMVPKKEGEPNNARPMCYASPWDAIVALAVLNAIGPEIDSKFHRKSYGNRLAKGPKADGQIFEDWRKQNYLRELHREGFSYYDENHYYILTDITRFYEFVRHDKLLALLSRYIKEQEVLYIIQQYIEAKWLSAGSVEIKKPGIGLPQGPALSAFLANLYLDELDSWLEDKCKDFVRYVDDLALLFESEESAKKVFKELKQFLHINFGLSLNEDIDKTKGPFPVSQKEPLIDWIRDNRYDIVKFTRNNKSLTLIEKYELHNVLKYISGAKLEDRKDLERFIKYLGFYVVNTEKLDQEELNEGVYVLANFVLTEYRPKHNATCIAMRALIKSCIESGNANANYNFRRLKDILEKRKDEYIYLVFLRETRKWLEENQLDTEINPEIIKEIEECVASPSFEISAEAIQCLIIINKISDPCKNKLVEIFNSGRINIRARAGYLLGKTGNINSGDLARVVSNLIDGTEIAIALRLINSKLITKPIIDELALSAKTTNIISEECLSYLLLASIVTGSEDGIIMCQNANLINNGIDLDGFYYHIASKIIEFFVSGQIKFDLHFSLKVCSKNRFYGMAKYLYDLGKLYMPEIEEFPFEEDEKFQISPKYQHILPGFELKESILNVGGFLFLAEKDDSSQVYYEVISKNEITSLGAKPDKLVEAMEALEKNNLLLLDHVEQSPGYVIGIHEYNNNWKTLVELISERPFEYNEIITLFEKITSMLLKVKDIFNNLEIPLIYMPVPTTHTIKINHLGEIRFCNITLTLANGRQYIGIQKRIYSLPRECWEVFALGLFFCEIVTRNCIITSLEGYIDKVPISQIDVCKVKGKVFTTIVAKATSHLPQNRYKAIEFLNNDIRTYCLLEIYLEKHLNEDPVLADCIRNLFGIQLHLERWLHVEASECNSFLSIAPEFAKDIIKELKESGELNQEWLKESIGELTIKRGSKKTAHVATLQTEILAHKISEKWSNLTENIDYQYKYFIPEWLYLASALNEIESLRRLLWYLWDCNKNRLKPCIDISISCAEANNGEAVIQDIFRTEYLKSVYPYVKKYIEQISERMSNWLTSKVPPKPKWPIDLIIMAIIILVYKNNKNPRSSHSLPEKVSELLIKLYFHDVNYFKFSTSNPDVIFEAASVSREFTALLYRSKNSSRIYKEFVKKSSDFFVKKLMDPAKEHDISDIISNINGPLMYSTSSALPFPGKVSIEHRNCLCSMDIINLKNGTKRVSALSIPPVTYTEKDGTIYPKMKKVFKLKEGIKCFVGLHMIAFFISILLFVFQCCINAVESLKQSPLVVTLYGYIQAMAWGLLLFYFGICFDKLKKLRGWKNSIRDFFTKRSI